MNKSYSKVYRLMHWGISLTFILLLITIFLRLTWLNKQHMADIIGSYLNEKGQTLSEDELIVLAKQIREPMWQWHVYLGYVLVGLFSLRFALPVFGEMKIQNPFNKTLTTKEKFQRWVYVIFYGCVVVSLVTGLLIEFGPKEFKKPVEEVHELSIYYLLPFIVLHLGGVLLAEFTHQKGIISNIISGKKTSKSL